MIDIYAYMCSRYMLKLDLNLYKLSTLTVKKLYSAGRLSKLVKIREQLHLDNNIHFTTYAMHCIIYRYPSGHNRS